MKNKKVVLLGITFSMATALLVGCSATLNEQNIDTEIVSEYNNDYSSEDETIDKNLSEISEDFSEGNEDSEYSSEGNEDIDDEIGFVQAKLVRVVDGDTYVVNIDGQDTKVRLIGVDTPESVAPESYTEKTGKENTKEGLKVSEHMKDILKEGDLLFLEFDVQMYDKYDRVLAYAYFDDMTMIQEYLLENGLAQVMTIQPNSKYSKRFVELEQKAIKNGVGIWYNNEER